jgi:predicted phosphodiesterase
MRLGIFGDIHNNYEALTASYKVLERAGCDQMVCTGDIVGYGGSPKECIDFFWKHEIVSVKGNHDHYTTQIGYDWKIQPYAKEVIKWMQDTLDSDYIDWLNELPFTYEVGGVQFVHASLETADGTSWPYILDSQTAMFHFFMQMSHFCFYGHTHIPLLFTIKKGQVVFELLTTRKFPKKPIEKFLLNPGSVGQPRDFNSKAAVTVFDTKTHEIELYRINYDIAAAQDKIIKAGLPTALAERLHAGR